MGYQLVAKIRSFINYAWDLDAIFKYFYLEKLMLRQISSCKKDTEFKIFYYVSLAIVLMSVVKYNCKFQPNIAFFL